jgi:mono/diheme cytochrome c family protein
LQRKILRWGLRVALAAAILAGGTGAVGLAYFTWYYPVREPPPDLLIAATPAQIERGRYLAQHAAGCIACHSERDWSFYSGPLVEGTEGGGGPHFLDPSFHSANITPAAVAEWSDGELFRAISSGITRNGSALDPRMPWEAFAGLPPQDLEALVAYLRTLRPVSRSWPTNRVPLDRRLFARTLPRPYRAKPAPRREDTVAYGRLLAGLGSCNFCHDLDLSGGRRFKVPGGGEVVARNLTPDETGLGALSRDNFIGGFKAFASPEARRIPVGTPPVNTVMPWTAYAGMTEADLGALYDYLRSVAPVRRIVARPGSTPSPTAGQPGAP